MGNTNVSISLKTLDLLKGRKHMGQSYDGVIREMYYSLTEEVCPICKRHSAGCQEHKDCAVNKEMMGY